MRNQIDNESVMLSKDPTNQAITNSHFILPFHPPSPPLKKTMSNYPHAHTRGSRRGRSRPSLPPRGRTQGHIAMNPAWVHEGGEVAEETDYREDQPAGWNDYEMTHSNMYSNVPVNYTPQSSSMSSLPNTHTYYGSYTNPTTIPQFTFTTTSTPSNIRGRTQQHEQTHQGYQPSTLTRGYFTNAIESIQPRRQPRRNPPPPVAIL